MKVFSVLEGRLVHVYKDGECVYTIGTLKGRTNGPYCVTAGGMVAFRTVEFEHREEGPALYFSATGLCQWVWEGLPLEESEFHKNLMSHL